MAATPDHAAPAAGVLDALEGLAFELEHVQLRVSALEHRMTAQEADPGPELVARRTSDKPPLDRGDGWERFDARAERLIGVLRELGESAAAVPYP